MTVDEQDTAHTGAAEIGRKAGRGLRWSILGNLGTKAGSFVMSLVLARLLVPHDYGLYAIALAASQFLIHVNDVGILAATVQWRGKLEDLAPTATVMAFLFSTGIYGIFFALAPIYADISGTPEATPIIRLLTVIIIIDGVTAVRAGALLRRFQQDKLTYANLAGFLVQACVAISLAAGGAGAYSFVWGQLANDTVTAVLVLWLAGVPMKLGFDRDIVLHLLKFGSPLAVSLGIEALLVNADKVVIGDALGATMVGFYMVAFNISSWVPGLIGTAVRYVSLPSFSRLAEEDSDTLSSGVQRSIPVMIAFVLPFALVMGLLAPAFIDFLYGDEWYPAAAALQFLAVVMVVRMLMPLAFDVLTALGRTSATVWLNLSWCVALIPALIIGTRLGGIRGASLGQAVAGGLIALPLAAFALHRAGVRLGPIAPRLVRPTIAALASAAVIIVAGRVLHGDPPAIRLIVGGGLGFAVFAVLAMPVDQYKRLVVRLSS